MRHLNVFVLASTVFVVGSLQAAPLPPQTSARLVLMISKGSGEGGQVACKHEGMAAELAKAGCQVSAGARIAWAANAAEARVLAMQGKLVVGPDAALLNQGAGLALVEEGGRPKLLLNPRNVQKSGVHLSDTVLKAAMGS